MLKEFYGVNISSKSPEKLAKFYNEKLGVPILSVDDNSYDGVELGFIKDSPKIIIWDEYQWGKSSEGSVNFVFRCDNLDDLYKELKDKDVEIEPPITAVWGGKELKLLDLDGNSILILE